MKFVITENDSNERSHILHEEALVDNCRIWETTPDNWLGKTPNKAAFQLDLKPGHIVTQYVEIQPDTVMKEVYKSGKVPGIDENGFHRTRTIDYIILIEGRLILELDEGTSEIKPGDIVIQRSTNHAWRNPESQPAKVLSVMVTPSNITD